MLTDVKGNPITFYHGTTEEFDEFDIDKSEGMIWLTDTKKYAEVFSNGKKVKEMNVVMEKPLDVKTLKNERTIPRWKKIFKDMEIDTSKIDWEAADWAPDYGKYTFFDLLPHAGNNYLNIGTLNAIKKAGYDGILAPKESNDGIVSKTTIVVFDPSQIIKKG